MRVPAFVDAQLQHGAVPVRSNQMRLFGRVIEAVRRAIAEQNAMRELAAMDDRMLRDIGITRCDIAAMAKHRTRPVR